MLKNRHLNWGRGVKYMSNYTLFISGLLYFTSRILKLNNLAQLHFKNYVSLLRNSFRLQSNYFAAHCEIFSLI